MRLAVASFGILLACTRRDDTDASSKVDADSDGYGVDVDCDDGDASVHPEAAEICDGADQDCDGENDNGVLGTWYLDADEDGFGGEAVTGCEAPDGAVETGGDCDDDAFRVNPSIEELCANAIDDNCDGVEEPCTGSLPSLSTRHVGHTKDDIFGSGLLAPGDLDGDGVADLLVGAEGASHVYNGGLVYLVPGGSPSTSDAEDLSVYVTGQTSEWIGTRLAMGDLTGDGAVDLVVGSPYDSAKDIGLVFVLPMGPAGMATTDATAVVKGTDVYDMAGYSEAVGDLDGDGLVDLAIGVPMSDPAGFGGDPPGAAVIFPGPLSGTMTRDAGITLAGADEDEEAGKQVLISGDLDGDGRDDLVVGARRFHIDARNSRGAAYVLTAIPASGSLADAAGKVVGEAYDDGTGTHLAGVGDVDGDGKPDLAVGRDDGNVYLFSGAPSGEVPISAANAVITGIPDPIVASGGDPDGDGIDDLLVGGRGLFLFRGPIAGTTDAAAASVRLEAASPITTLLPPVDLDDDGRLELVSASSGEDSKKGVVYVTPGLD
jgi:hypothetical protein